jgi:hypothetical protein
MNIIAETTVKRKIDISIIEDLKRRRADQRMTG